MQVSFNPSINYRTVQFGSASKRVNNENTAAPTKDEIVTARTKKAISECKYVVFGLGILYFAMKHNIKINKIKNHEKKLAELAKMKVPTPHLMNVNIDELLNVTGV